MSSEETIKLFQKYVIPNYGRFPVSLVRGEGSHVWDSEGNRYLDLFPGWGCNGLGHCHPKVVKAVKQQAGKLIHVDNTFYNELQGELAMRIAVHSFRGKCFFCNSGAEAIEGAIKFARIVTPAGPLSPGFAYVPYNDIDALAAAVDDETCAVLLEPVQGEGGVNPASDAYLAQVRELCDGRDVLLILDEVQTGCGRTGEYFAHTLFGIDPDILTTAKALGGGVAIGAIEARPDIADRIVPGLHASTFGGNPLACAAAIAVFKAIEEDGLLENARAMGKHLRRGLRELAEKTGRIAEVRGLGLMVGAELRFPGADLVKTCLENGLLINCTHDTVLRLLPALTVTQAELDEGIGILATALERHGGG